MMKVKLFFLPAMVLAGASHSATVLYVSPTGSDRGSVTIDAPFATLERARDAIRNLKKGGKLPEDGATVVLHGPHNAIQLGGNEHLIEFNEIHHVCSDTGDVGAFYMGRDWTARGTVIRHNFWHHISGPGRIGAMGVYLDDQASGITIYGKPSVHIDARGLGWQKRATDDPGGTLRSRLRSMPYRNELWRERYPELVNILDDDPGTPKRNGITKNISVGGNWEHIDVKTRKYQVIRDNLINRDPAFVNKEMLDFRLRPASPAFQLGFQKIPVERIGLYRDDRRASWPRSER